MYIECHIMSVPLACYFVAIANLQMHQLIFEIVIYVCYF